MWQIFLHLHPFQKVLYWLQDLPPKCGMFYLSEFSSEGTILVARSLSIMWWIFLTCILFRRYYIGYKISLYSVADLLHLHLPQRVL